MSMEITIHYPKPRPGSLTYSFSVLIFIIVILLLSADFYYCKNIAGRRLVGLRWWNETNGQTGEQTWVFESADPSRVINATDSRFFWLSLYSIPVLWGLLAILALVRFKFTWLPLVAIAVTLCITNTLAFSRCDKFSNASSIANRAFSGSGIAGTIASGMVSRLWSR
ncbi:Golgi apparatus membrane protein tvp23, variant 2 [Orbilia oligospora]|uniref:Golgi apparatus membrane protein TVP23 n=1 Tax=Orbilia oligospora TaxID=2813651 RepID=A0A7C8J9F7_ORBOL|nr:Golgi apparatus membrane protein tvp23, variant 2 [Orbilia oligospora]KAF3098435.1 Golgi apparatus membrane protein tvp23, variant 2 [Orbilia oligospora]KAF3109085.1 Golgi apparatus membrane protein tvp23, variant 2 [Orbilia oligospora]KAF3120874.1 Golgi apparatus membrane protein tvp23, variant 2 [Orbilia oligospora]KAF3123300.1 Golgi apparatus membrane protein tvp23, variant 2 [Orbilia oligospora]